MAYTTVNGLNGTIKAAIEELQANVTDFASGDELKYARVKNDLSGFEYVTVSGGSGITTLNGLTADPQTFATGTSGTDFAISSATSTHTFNLPTASATNRGALSSADWSTFNNKQSTGLSWLLASGGTLTGANTITSNAANQLLFSGSWTTSATEQYHITVNPSITGSGNSGQVPRAFFINPTLTQGANSQNLEALRVDGTFSTGGFTTGSHFLIRASISGSDRFTVQTGGTVVARFSNHSIANAWMEVSCTAANSFRFLQSTGYGITVNPSLSDINMPSTSVNFRSQAGAALTLNLGGQDISSTTARTFVTIKPVESASTAYTPTTGTSIYADFTLSGNASFAPSSGTATHTHIRIRPTINQTGTASGAVTYLDIDAIRTGILGTEYGALIRHGKVGIGTATPTHRLEVVATVNNEDILRIADDGGNNIIQARESGGARQLGFYGVTPASRPSAYTPTNVTTDRSYDANATTLDEVADVLGTLIADLQSLGLIS